MDIYQSIKKKKNIVIAVLVILTLIALSYFFFIRETEPAPEPAVKERDVIEEKDLIQRQLDELNVIREERLQGEEFVPLTEEETQRQLEELDALRRRQNQQQ